MAEVVSEADSSSLTNTFSSLHLRPSTLQSFPNCPTTQAQQLQQAHAASPQFHHLPPALPHPAHFPMIDQRFCGHPSYNLPHHAFSPQLSPISPAFAPPWSDFPPLPLPQQPTAFSDPFPSPYNDLPPSPSDTASSHTSSAPHMSMHHADRPSPYPAHPPHHHRGKMRRSYSDQTEELLRPASLLNRPPPPKKLSMSCNTSQEKQQSQATAADPKDAEKAEKDKDLDKVTDFILDYSNGDFITPTLQALSPSPSVAVVSPLVGRPMANSSTTSLTAIGRHHLEPPKARSSSTATLAPPIRAPSRLMRTAPSLHHKAVNHSMGHHPHNDPDCLKTPTMSDMLQTPTPNQLTSPFKHTPAADDTPRFSFSQISLPPPPGSQHFFGENEPLMVTTNGSSTHRSDEDSPGDELKTPVFAFESCLPSTSGTQSASSSSTPGAGGAGEEKDKKPTAMMNGKHPKPSLPTIATSCLAPPLGSPGLNGGMFQFSPLVEHFLQTISNRSGGLPELSVMDAETPKTAEAPDLLKLVCKPDGKEAGKGSAFAEPSAPRTTKGSAPQQVSTHFSH